MNRAGSIASDFGTRLAPLGGLVLVLIAAAITSPSLFESDNLRLILFQIGVIGITALGQTLVLLVAGIDLSVGAVIGLTAVIVAAQTDGSNGALPVAIALAVLAGIAVGLLNAALVILRGVPPFVATFASFVLVEGAVTAATRGAPSGTIPSGLHGLGADRLLGIPVPLLVFALLAILLGLVLARTSAGRRLYTTGLNPRAAAMSGIRTPLVIASAYVACSLFAVLAGLVDAGYVGFVDAQLSRELNLESIAAAVIGGVALTGGEGTVGQTVCGVVLLAVLLVWMVELGTGVGGQLAVEGAVILVAVWFQRQSLARKLSAKG
jgi:ribose/xylose/arabinose/galactoside ABC-type transport system permease subunit